MQAFWATRSWGVASNLALKVRTASSDIPMTQSKEGEEIKGLVTNYGEGVLQNGRRGGGASEVLPI